jgi:site-specific DNA-methyltransferase (adenine-specific)
MGTFEEKGVAKQSNFHPTVKPVQLMRYLIRMVTPPNGVVLDPFLGSGTTAVAATLEGYDWKGCELTEDYLAIIKGRVTWAVAEKKKLNKQAKQLTLEEQV